MAVIGKLIAQLSLDAATFVRDLNAAGDSLDKAGRRMTSVGKNISTYISAPLIGLGALALKTSSEFESGMNKLESVSGATGTELRSLREEAKKLGAQIEFGKFSALDAASGMTDLAQAGFKTNEIITAMPGLLQLATASQMELADAAETVSSILRGYGLQVTDLAHVNDVLTKASIETNAELSTLGEAMKFVGPVASAAGLSFEEIAAAVGKLSDAGIQGEMAGTALRGSITRLINPTDEAASLLELYGVEVTDVTGKMRSLTDIISDFEQGSQGLQGVFGMLAEQMGGIDGIAASFSENFAAAATAMVDAGDVVKKVDFIAAAQKAAESMGLAGDQAVAFAEEIQRSWEEASFQFTSGQDDLTELNAVASAVFNEMAAQGVRVGDIMTIFNQRAGPAMAALINQGSDSLKDLTAALEASGGTAAKVASTQLQGFGAAMEGLRSSFEGLMIAIGDSGLLEFATKLVKEITGLIEVLSTLDPATLKFASILAAAVAAGGPLLVLLGGATIAIGALLSPIGLVVTAIVGTAGIVAAIYAFRKEIGTALTSALDNAAQAFVDFKDTALAAVKALVEGIEEWLGARLQGAFDGVQAKVQGFVDIFQGAKDILVGNSIIPDMVMEIEGWMERLDEAMVKPADYAVTRTVAAFGKLPDHIRSALIASQGEVEGWQETLAKGPAMAGTGASDDMVAPFESAAQSLSDTFATTFENILQEGVTSFEELGDSVGRIFTNLTANIGQQFGQTLTMLGGFGGPLGSFGGAALGIGAMFGLSKIGSALGLGGGPQSNKVAFGPGALGQAGAGGTGAGAEFIRGVDQGLIGLLSARQEAIVNQALAAAPSIPVQFSKQPSANDLSNMSRSRIGPAAQALGFNPDLIAGPPQQFSAEQQSANLQAAVELQRAIAGIQIGPVAVQFRDLNDTFDEMIATATMLGLSTAELAQQRHREAEALERQIHLERIAVSAQVGALDPFTASVQTLHAQMQEAAARADDLGISTRNLNVEFARQAAILGQQERIRIHSVMGTVGVMDDLTVALQNLDAEMRLASLEAERLGISTTRVATEHRRRAEELVRQSRLERISVMGAVGIMDPLTTALQMLQVQMEEAAAQADRLGISTATVTREHQLQANILVQQERLRLHDIMLQVGATSELGAALGNLNAQMQIAINEANRLGISTANVHREFHLQANILIQQERLRQHGIMESLGVINEFDRAILDLNANMQIAWQEATRLGISTARLHEEFARGAAAIERQRAAQIDSLALLMIEPFERMRAPLEEFGRELERSLGNPLEQMQSAAEQFRDISQRALGGDLAAIEQFQGAGQRFIEEAGRFGASPGQVAAINEVAAVNRQLMETVDAAQREASTGVEDAVRQASQRQIDTMRELIDVGREQIEEIKRLRR